MKILTIVGARPQFIKAAMVSRAVLRHNAAHPEALVTEEILHTGQHYDENMSDVFFRQMGIPAPAVNLNIGSGLHGAMTARMLEGIEKEILDRKPDMVLVYGDTNSTLAGALAASKLHVPVAHVEAGLRSFNKRMPEEINRILTDHVSSLLFCPTHAAVKNLANENITKGVHHVGDVMYDAALVFGEIAERESTILKDLALSPKKYLLATVHRAENTDDPVRLRNIMAALQELAVREPVIFPVHPRTRAKFRDQQSAPPVSDFRPPTSDLGSRTSALRLIPPLSFLDMVQMEKHARCILTDSGGVQKEAYFHRVPCVTLRDETEWIETIEAGWNQVVGAEMKKIIAAVHQARAGSSIPEYGQGNCAEDVVELLIACLSLD